MVVLALFFLLVIFLILFSIPLLKRVLDDYDRTLKIGSEKVKENQDDTLAQALNVTVNSRWEKLDKHFSSPLNYDTNQFNPEDLLQLLKVYLQSILKILKSEDGTP